MSFLSLSTDSVSHAYPEEPVAVSGDATVGEVLQLMRAQRASCALVCNQGKVEGIFTERDAMRWMAEGAATQTAIRDYMTRRPITIEANSAMGHAIEVMAEGGYRHLPLVDKSGAPQGVIAVRGIVHYLVDHFPQTIYTLPPEPGRAPASREGA